MPESHVLSGPEDTDPIPLVPLGHLVYEKLKNGGTAHDVVLVDGATGEELTYRQLLQWTVKVAVGLMNVGVKSGDVITVVAQNSCKYIVACLASFLIGAKLNLLNHDYTAHELKHFFSICKPKVIFCTNKTASAISGLEAEISSCAALYSLDQEPSELKSFEDLSADVTVDDVYEFEPADLDPDQQVALVLTSSGTTGFPKAVMLTHTNVRVLLLYARDPRYLDLNDKETTIGYLPLFHIFGIGLALSSILFGTKLVVLEKFKPDQFLETIQKQKVTKLFAVPPILLFLLKTPLLSNYDVTSINDVICGAAPMDKDIQEAVEKRLNLNCIRQMYGMTESSGATTVSPKDVRKVGSVGKVTVSFRAKVCDVDSKLSLGPNQVGEICVKGPGVMKGYLGNDEETRATFDDEGFLKTGDLGYYDQDQYFYVVDRLKELIKYKGFQVAPAELESILMKHPNVKDAGVVGIPDKRAGEVPVAFVVKQPGAEVTEEELQGYVAEHVSQQKHLYGGVRFVDEIPKNPSGKILRKKLKELALDNIN